MTGRMLLSLFPGIDVLGLAFAEVFPDDCIVRGPDVIFGSLHDVRSFHVPAGVFWGVFGGPPCQMFSQLVRLVRANGHEPHFGNLIPEFARIIEEAQPVWYLMENVPAAPVPEPAGYHPAHELILNNRWLGEEQNRLRRFCSGVRGDLEPRRLDVTPDIALFEAPLTVQAVCSADRAGPVKVGGSGKVKSSYQNALTKDGKVRTVTASHPGSGTVTAGHNGGNSPMVRYPVAEAIRLQGLPEGFLDNAPFTRVGKLKAIANGVPLPMGRAVAKAIKRVMER